jgi:serine/threonine-protein kinase
VHRDISPQNILVGVDGVSRVIDFGIAKASGRLQTTSEGSVKGKIAYMASEQLMAQQVTRRADVFAMGVVLWEMLAGRRLFQAESEAVLVAVVLAGARVAPSHHSPAIPPDLDALVMKALASDPGQRFESARAMAEALCAIVPPAFPAEVGAWVQQAAAESLAGREAVLAEIESGSGAVVVAGAALSDAALADDPTREEIANLVVETPANERPAAQSRRTRLVALGSVALVATAALGIELAWPSKLRATPTTIVASTVAASEPLSVGSETSPPRDSAGAAEATPVDLPPPTATATATATASARLSPHPAGHAGHARATPSAAASAAPLHFTRPD